MTLSIQDLVDQHNDSERSVQAAVNAHRDRIETLRASLEVSGPQLTDDGVFLESLDGKLRILKPGRTTATPARVAPAPAGLPGPG